MKGEWNVSSIAHTCIITISSLYRQSPYIAKEPP